MKKSTNRAESLRTDLPPEQMEAIGRVAVEWCYLESTMDVAIGRLAGFLNDDIADAVTKNIRSRTPLLATLFDLSCQSDGQSKQASAARRREFDTILRRVNELAELRNRFVHARWVKGSPGSPYIYTVKTRGEFRRELEGWSAAEIRAVADEIGDHSNALRSFFGLEEEWLVSP